jgi:hypothetical protein
MAPSDVEQIITNTEQYDTLQREDCSEERRKFVMRELVKKASCLDLL